MALIGLVVGLGLFGVLGPTTDVASGGDASLRVELVHASVTRGGLATPWVVEVRREGGFDSPVIIATTADYFDGFDFHTLYPEPTDTTMRGELVVFRFAPPAGEVLRVRLDARATPSWTFWRSATTVVSTSDLPEVRVAYRTIFLP